MLFSTVLHTTTQGSKNSIYYVSRRRRTYFKGQKGPSPCRINRWAGFVPSQLQIQHFGSSRLTHWLFSLCRPQKKTHRSKFPGNLRISIKPFLQGLESKGAASHLLGIENNDLAANSGCGSTFAKCVCPTFFLASSVVRRKPDHSLNRDESPGRGESTPKFTLTIVGHTYDARCEQRFFRSSFGSSAK